MHGHPSFFSCTLCTYRSKRSHDLERHNKTKHRSKSSKLVASLLDRLLEKIVNEKKRSENDIEIVSAVMDDILDRVVEAVESKEKLSDYERIRNEIIAARDAAFKKRFPTFEQEVRALYIKYQRTFQA